RREPWPQGHRNEQQEALAIHRSRLEHRGEHEVVDGQQRKRVQKRPCQAGGAAQVARKKLATEKILKQHAMALQRATPAVCRSDDIHRRHVWRLLARCPRRSPNEMRRKMIQCAVMAIRPYLWIPSRRSVAAP